MRLRSFIWDFVMNTHARVDTDRKWQFLLCKHWDTTSQTPNRQHTYKLTHACTHAKPFENFVKISHRKDINPRPTIIFISVWFAFVLFLLFSLFYCFHFNFYWHSRSDSKLIRNKQQSGPQRKIIIINNNVNRAVAWWEKKLLHTYIEHHTRPVSTYT